MKRLLLFLLFIPTFLFSQSIWEEDFESYADFTGLKGSDAFTENAGYTPGAVSKWELNASFIELSSATTDYFYINVSSGDGEIRARDIDGSAYFTTENFDISSQSGDVTIKFDKVEFDPLTSGNFSGSEYIDVFYSLDGGTTFNLIPYQAGSESGSGHTFADNGDAGVDFTTSLDFTFDPGAATNLIVQIKMYNNGSNEIFEIDDISIERSATVLWSENFDSYSDNYGYVGIAGLAAANNNSGDYPGSVSKWSLSPSAGFANQNDYAAVRSGVLIFNDVDNAVTFETEDIDITGVSDLTFSFDVNFGINFDGGEYLDIYYSTDGGSSFTLDATGTHTFEAMVNVTESSTANFSKDLSGLSASNLRIRVVAFSESNVEDFEIDNIVVTNTSSMSVDEVFSASVNVYPNPVSGSKVVFIDSPLNTNRTVSLFDMLGKEVYKVETSNKRIDVSSLNNGIYLLQLEEDDKVATKRLIIQ